MQFVNRHEELAFLNRYSNESGFQFVPLYGRRRVGKTRLVQEFLHGKRAVYFMADSVSECEQLKNLGREVGELFGDIILVESGFRDWQQFFAYISEKSSSERMVLVISRSGFTDEMQELASADGVMLVHGDKLGGMMKKDNYE